MKVDVSKVEQEYIRFDEIKASRKIEPFVHDGSKLKFFWPAYVERRKDEENDDG